MTETPVYTREGLDELKVEELASIVAALGVEPTGTGTGGNVLKSDIVDAILDNQAAAALGAILAGETPPASPPADPPAADGKVAIVRQTPAVWWCPIDDFSQPQSYAICGGCGAERDGDEVTQHADR